MSFSPQQNLKRRLRSPGFPLPVHLAALVVAATTLAIAGGSASNAYRITADIVDAGGGSSESSVYSNVGSVGGDMGVSEALAPPARAISHGWIGQLYEPRTLAISATPSSVVEGMTTQLDAVVTMDDDTLVHLGSNEPSWTVLDGPIASVSSAGEVTASEVFVNAPANIRGSWNGVSGDVTFTVLNTNIVEPGSTVPDPVFTPLLFAVNQAGLYQGLLRDNGGNVVGALTGFKLLTTRTFTGKVIFNGLTYSVSGSLLPDGSFTGQITRKGKTPLLITLQIGSTATGGLALHGTVAGDATVGTGLIAKAPYAKLSPAPVELSRSYTFLVPATTTGDAGLPEGDGYGSAKVSSLGVVTASGKTGDGVAFSTTGYLTADRQWHLFQLLYSSKGQIAGVLSFRDVAGISDLDGQIHWAKNPNPLNKSYPQGFALAPRLVGSFYSTPTVGQRVLGQLANQHYNARLTLAGTALVQGGIAKTLSWLNTNVLTYYGPEKLSARTTTSTGILTGSYYDPVIKLTVAFAGAVLQKQNLAAGNFLLANKAGYLLVEPGTQFPYPGSEGAGALVRLTLPSSPAPAPVLSPANFSTGAAGSFGGVLENGPDVSGGLENVVVTSTGALSGTVAVEGKRYAFKSVIGSTGMASVVITRKGMTDITGTLQLAIADGTVDGFQLTGTLTVDGTVHEIDAQRFPVFTKTLPAPQNGLYTLAMCAPDGADVSAEPGGDSYASLKVAYTGACTGTLNFADGTTTTFAGRVSRNGEWSLHRSLYGTSNGYLAGKLTFRSLVNTSDLDGQWRWVKPNAVPKTLSYPGGFRLARGVVGSRYTPPATGSRALSSLPNTGYNAWLRFKGPDMSTLPALTLLSLDRTVTWSTANKILYYGPDKATITFNPATGLATGSYTDTVNGVKVTFGGALIQKQGVFSGRYIASGQTGLVMIQSR